MYLKQWILNSVPVWFRDKFPLKRFYWQKEELEAAQRWADQYKDIWENSYD